MEFMDGYSDQIEYYKQHAGAYPNLSNLEINGLIAQYRENGDMEARAKAINSNFRIVFKTAKESFPTYQSLFSDLVQEGNIGLMSAIDKFNYNGKIKFSTYAIYWIKASMTRFIQNHARSVRIPVHREEMLLRISKVKNELSLMTGTEPTVDEISEYIGVEKSKIEKAITIGNTSSIDELEEESSCIVDSEALTPVAIAEKNFAHDSINELLDLLSDKEKIVVKMRYSMNDEREKYTLNRIGEELDMSLEMVRHIEKRAIKKMLPVAEERQLRLCCI